MKQFLQTSAVVLGSLWLAACSTTSNQAGDADKELAGQPGQHQLASAEDQEGAEIGRMRNNGFAESERQSKNFSRMAEFAANNKCVPAKPIAGIEQHFFFSFDRDVVSESDVNVIQTQVNYLLRHPQTAVRIEGNTDDRGSREYNVALGARRANAVVRQLKQQGVPNKQIHIVSYGAEKPAALGENESAYRCNRRVDLVFEGS